MSTHVYAYGGATCEDVYAELDDKPSDYINLELMSSPQCAFISTEYSEELIMGLAQDMWDEIAEFYPLDPDNPNSTKIPLEALNMVACSRVCERPANFDGELPVKEVTEVHFYGGPHFNDGEALMQIVVQKRPVRLPKRRARTLAEILPDFGARPGDNGNSEA